MIHTRVEEEIAMPNDHNIIMLHIHVPLQDIEVKVRCYSCSLEPQKKQRKLCNTGTWKITKQWAAKVSRSVPHANNILWSTTMLPARLSVYQHTISLTATNDLYKSRQCTWSYVKGGNTSISYVLQRIDEHNTIKKPTLSRSTRIGGTKLKKMWLQSVFGNCEQKHTTFNTVTEREPRGTTEQREHKKPSWVKNLLLRRWQQWQPTLTSWESPNTTKHQDPGGSSVIDLPSCCPWPLPAHPEPPGEVVHLVSPCSCRLHTAKKEKNATKKVEEIWKDTDDMQWTHTLSQ